MDGVSEDSPFLALFLLQERIDRVLEEPAFFLVVGVFLIYYVFFGGWLDLVLILSFSAFNNLTTIRYWIHDTDVVTNGLITGASLLAGWISFQAMRSQLNKVSTTWNGAGTPYLIPCRTSHTRFFPKKHSFSYSYLTVGIPVGFRGSVNGMVSTDVFTAPKTGLSTRSGTKGWFDVSSEDYLHRGHGELGLRGKLDEYLATQDADPATYPHAYLVTAPRFLGYHFNPVSFWYLYSSEKVLSAIVLEVNNTFGERRPYFVTRDFQEEAKQLPGSAAQSVGADEARARVKNSWQKDFHVSPFNSRKGSYSLLARDPLGANMDGFRGIDVTINLSSSKGHPKLVARLFSEGAAIEPSSMNAIQRLLFLLRWFWVGFVTFPRIVKEAGKLFFKRKLHVWYRPEPLKDSLGRHADNTEKKLEVVFRLYLRHLVEQSPSSLVVRYIPSGITEFVDEIFTSKVSRENSGSAERIEIKILTPVFYSRFVHYAHDFEGIFSELAENCTIWVDKPDMLPKIFLRKAPPPLHSSSAVEFLTFKMIQKLRQRPQRIEQPLTSAETPSSSTAALDIRGFRMSAMDAFVLGLNDAKVSTAYRFAVLRLFLADSFFMGSIELLSMAEFASRVAVSWALVFAVRSTKNRLSTG